MARIETGDLHQYAAYWAVSGFDNYGEQTVSAAIEIRLRWEKKTVEGINPEASRVAYESVAYVNRTMAVGDILWLGRLADVASPPVDLREVVEYTEIPDVKNRHVRRRVFLRRFSNELPTIA